ncbi:hypothetical protein MKW98_004511 [Papaver atlanticum]|uniref:Uncharacterized protein n=1 Tax=Papaver atlanticum TaxID=357466 RepID=A0AAD4SQ73_9MAGN|nr:hypothetical protein MKW98_004511 [Papaver atlanticum]
MVEFKRGDLWLAQIVCPVAYMGEINKDDDEDFSGGFVQSPREKVDNDDENLLSDGNGTPESHYSGSDGDASPFLVAAGHRIPDEYVYKEGYYNWNEDVCKVEYAAYEDAQNDECAADEDDDPNR